MELKILDQKENKLLNRKELSVVIDNNNSTPKREDIVAKIAAMQNVDKSLVAVDSIRQKFGAKKSHTYIKIYHSAEDFQKTEPKPKEKTAPTPTPATPQAAAPEAKK